MKITKRQLQRIIKEELSRILNESLTPGMGEEAHDSPARACDEKHKRKTKGWYDCMDEESKKKNEVDEGLFGQSGWEKERDRQHAESPEGKKEAEKKAANTTRRILKGLKRYKGGHVGNPWTDDELKAASAWLRTKVKSASNNFGVGKSGRKELKDYYLTKNSPKEYSDLIDDIWAGQRDRGLNRRRE